MGKGSLRTEYVRVIRRRYNGEVTFSTVMTLTTFRAMQARWPDRYAGLDYVPATYDEWLDD